MYINFNTLFLEIVFESFKSISKQKSELDPAIFMTVPKVSLSTCLEKMNGNFEQLNDLDMSMFIDEAPIIGKMLYYTPAPKLVILNALIMPQNSVLKQ